MRKLLLLLTSALLAHSVFSQTKADIIRQALLERETNTVFVAAHRGSWRHAAENSLKGIEHAINIGVDIIEIDIQRSKDGHLVLMHDETLDRTTTGTGRVDELNIDSIKKLQLRNGIGIPTNETVPTLEEILIYTKGKVLLNLDKTDRYIDQVYALLKKTGTTNYVIMKTGYPFVDVRVQFHEYLFSAILMPIINLDLPYADSELQAYTNFLKPKIIELTFDTTPISSVKQTSERLQGRSALWYNTMWSTLAGGHDDDLALEDPNKAYGFLIDSLGANIIQTDRPAYLLEYLRSRNLHE